MVGQSERDSEIERDVEMMMPVANATKEPANTQSAIAALLMLKRHMEGRRDVRVYAMSVLYYVHINVMFIMSRTVTREHRTRAARVLKRYMLFVLRNSFKVVLSFYNPIDDYKKNAKY